MPSLLCLSVSLSFAAQHAIADSGKAVEVVTQSTDDGIVLLIKNVADAEAAIVKVWLAKANVQTDPAMLGSVSRKDGELVFRPRFPLNPGTKYNVQVSNNEEAEPDYFIVEVPAEKTVPTKVEQIYPTSEILPENILKFYIQFSAAMQKGDVYRYLQIRKVDGKQVELPFLEIEQELWSRDSKRLTLLLDPGRIKRGLKPREEMGPIFVLGNAYELVVDGKWPDSNGQSIGKDFVKRFRIGAEDHQQPDPNQWSIETPEENSKQPLVILLAEPLDHSMLQSAIVILNNESQPVAGRVEISTHQTQWSLIPKSPWKKGAYSIEINSRLEDNAGNSIEKQFDVDVFNKTQPSKSQSTRLTFKVG